MKSIAANDRHLLVKIVKWKIIHKSQSPSGGVWVEVEDSARVAGGIQGVDWIERWVPRSKKTHRIQQGHSVILEYLDSGRSCMMAEKEPEH